MNHRILENIPFLITRERILEVNPVSPKYGMIIREWSESNFNLRGTWKKTIDCIVENSECACNVHYYVYNHVFINGIEGFIRFKEFKDYDIIIVNPNENEINIMKRLKPYLVDDGEFLIATSNPTIPYRWKKEDING